MKPIKRVSQSISECPIELPIVMVLNLRSFYPLVNEHSDLIIQFNVSVADVSESWEQQDLPLKDLIQTNNFRVIRYDCLRQNRGGKAALIIDKRKYYIKGLCLNPITVPVPITVTVTVPFEAKKLQNKFKRSIYSCMFFLIYRQ